MAKKKLTVVIRANPFSWKTFEALRQAVGSAMNHEVSVIFMRDAVYSLTDWNPKLIGIEPFDKSFSALGMMDAKVYVEEEALRERGINIKDWGININIEPKDEICEIIKSSEVVLTW